MEPFRMVRRLNDAFWNPKFWMESHLSWEDLKSSGRVRYTNHIHLYTYAIPFAFVLLLLRYSLERFAFVKFANAFDIKCAKAKRAPSNAVLEKAFKSALSHKDVVGLAKKLNWTERQVERWLRLRKSQDKPSLLKKFTESCWKCLYYWLAFHVGLIILWEKSWLWNVDECWFNHPHQGVTNDIWWYYMISLAFYWASALSQFTDIRRKDFWYMLAHHIAAILLLSFSWICNFHRIGSLVLLLHDAADAVLDGGKIAKYIKYDTLCTFLFVVFTCVWIVTRIVIFPFHIIKSTAVDAPKIIGQCFPAYYVFNGLLILLFAIHLYWTYLILKLIKRTWAAGKVGNDIRSCSEADETEGEEN